MAPGILARYVDVEMVMGVLDHGDAQALRVEMGDEPRQERGLARTAPSRKADDFHSGSLSAKAMEPPSAPSLRAKRRNPESFRGWSGLLRRHAPRNDGRDGISFITSHAY